MKAPAALLCAALLAAACGTTAKDPSRSADTLFEAVSPAALAVIDAGSKSTDRKLALGAPSPDWKHVYSIEATSLVDTNPETGVTQGSLRLGAIYRLPDATASGVPGGLSPNGAWLVVQSSGSTTTRMLVIDTRALTIAHRVTLAGEFTFDAINDAGTNLYLIQHLNGREYYVRLFDLATNSLTDNIVVDKSDGNQAMTGVRLSGIASAGHGWLFSMYVREHDTPFIHALNLDGPFAFCLDLPGSGFAADGRESQWSLAMSPDGRLLFAVNAATGSVAVANAAGEDAPAVTRTAQFASPGKTVGSGPGAAVVAGGTLIAGDTAGLAFIDTSSLKLLGRTLDGWAIAGVGLSPDGKVVYAVNSEGRIAVVSVATRQITGMFDPSAGTPLALMRVATA